MPGVAALAALLAAERGRLLPWLAVAFGAGIVGYFALVAEPAAAWGLAALPPLLGALLLAARHPLTGWLLGLLAAASLGAAVAGWHSARQPPPFDPPRGAVQVMGRVAKVEALPEGRRVTIADARLNGGDPAARLVRVRLRDNDSARPQVGDGLTVRALIGVPAAPAYPGAWDFQRAAYFSGLGATGFALGSAAVAAGEAGPPPLAGLRAAIEARVTAVIAGASGAISVALLTGGQSAIPAPALAAMRDSGLAHLLSVSGLHIAIVMTVTFFTLRLLLAAVPWLALRLPVKPIAAVAALTVGGLYMLLCGGEVPMQRSFAMAALATLALLTGRRAITLRAWALAALAVMLIQPVAVLGPSFQMSFAAVLALVAGYEWLAPRLRALPLARGWRRTLLVGAIGLVATSLLAGAATTPFGLYHFGRLQMYGVVANAIAVPLTSVLVMPAGMAAVVLMPFGLEGLALVPMGWGVQAVIFVAETVASWPGAAVSAPPLPAWGRGLTALGLLWLCLWRQRWRLLGVPMLALGLASPLWQRPPDLLVSGDAKLIAFHAADAVHWQKLSGASNLTRDFWLRLWQAPTGVPLPALGEAAAGAISCDTTACRLRTAAGPDVVLLRSGPAAEACAAALLVVSAEPIRGHCAAPVIDRFSVWRNGAHAVWLESAGPRVLSDRAWRGDRPWVAPIPRPRARPTD